MNPYVCGVDDDKTSAPVEEGETQPERAARLPPPEDPEVASHGLPSCTRGRADGRRRRG